MCDLLQFPDLPLRCVACVPCREVHENVSTDQVDAAVVETVQTLLKSSGSVVVTRVGSFATWPNADEYPVLLAVSVDGPEAAASSSELASLLRDFHRWQRLPRTAIVVAGRAAPWMVAACPPCDGIFAAVPIECPAVADDMAQTATVVCGHAVYQHEAASLGVLTPLCHPAMRFVVEHGVVSTSSVSPQYFLDRLVSAVLTTHWTFLQPSQQPHEGGGGPPCLRFGTRSKLQARDLEALQMLLNSAAQRSLVPLQFAVDPEGSVSLPLLPLRFAVLLVSGREAPSAAEATRPDLDAFMLRLRLLDRGLKRTTNDAYRNALAVAIGHKNWAVRAVPCEESLFTLAILKVVVPPDDSRDSSGDPNRLSQQLISELVAWVRMHLLSSTTDRWHSAYDVVQTSDRDKPVLAIRFGGTLASHAASIRQATEFGAALAAAINAGLDSSATMTRLRERQVREAIQQTKHALQKEDSMSQSGTWWAWLGGSGRSKGASQHHEFRLADAS
jgi:hypothetical protein